jgi:acyl-coenzyme A synthetase/AMP-(fatty) acid ligase
MNDLVIIPVKDLNGIVTKLVGFTSMPFNKQQEKLIRTKSEDKLERIFFPKKIIYIDTMPITPSGKIDRNKLKELASNQ